MPGSMDSSVESASGKTFPPDDDNFTTTKNPRNIFMTRKGILACLVVLIILLVITVGVVVIIVLVQPQKVIHDETTRRTVGNKDVEDVVYVDSAESIQQYHIKDSEEEIWVLIDFNRYFELMKVKDDDAAGPATCYLSPLTALSPRFILTPNNSSSNDSMDSTDTNATRKSDIVDFKKSRYAIREKSMLGPRGEALCKDADVYWSIPICLQDGADLYNTDAGNSSSRGRRRKRYWYPWCSWDFGNCYNFNFPDSPYRTYYRCPIICTYLWY